MFSFKVEFAIMNKQKEGVYESKGLRIKSLQYFKK